MQRWALALPTALLLASLTASVAQAACLAPEPGAPPPSVSGDWCLRTALPPDQQTEFQWTVDSTTPTTLSFEALPGQLGAMALINATSGSELWRGKVVADGDAGSGPVLLVPGPYRVVIAAGPTGLVYRARALASGFLPDALSDAGTGAFTGTVSGTGGEIVIPWAVPEVTSGDLWTIDVQAPLGTSINLTLRDAAGAIVAYGNLADADNILRLPDLRVAPGSYTVSLGAPPAGTTFVVRAQLDARGTDFAAEPDDLPAQAHPIEAGVPQAGRLTTAGSGSERDYFALTVPPGVPRAFDVTLSSALPLPLSLSLTDETGRVRAQRYGTGVLALRSLVLGPGRHLLEVGGMLPADATYSLVLAENGAATGSDEIEPNDDLPDATPLPVSGQVSGAFTGVERDHIALAVNGDLQLWDIEAYGEGLTQLSLSDAAAGVVAGTGGTRGQVFALDRMLLPPGANVVRLDGDGGSWLLRAVPKGGLVPGEEYEPNNEAPRALALPIGQPQTGWLQRRDDLDLYSFHLAAAQRVDLSVAGPPGVAVRMSLAWGEWSNYVAFADGLATDGGTPGLVWRGLLPPGDYFVGLALRDERSREPYTLRLDTPPYFDRPLDLEPNEEPWQVAGREPAGPILTGDLAGGDADWFALGTLPAPGKLTVRAQVLGGSGAELRFTAATPPSSAGDSAAYVYAVGDTVEFDAPAGVPLFLRVAGATGAYRFSLGPEVVATAPPVDARLELETVAVAAFEPVAQRVAGRLSVMNRSVTPLQLRLDSQLSDERWQLAGLPDALDLAAGQRIDIPVEIEVPADASDESPMFADVSLTSGSSVPALARARIEVRAGIDPVQPHHYEPIPVALRGGLNAAALALGATVPTAPGLFDGVIDVQGVVLDIGQSAEVTLAGGGAAVPLAGVVLQPVRGGSPVDRLKDFAIEASADGVSFTRVLEATLSPAAREQAFVFSAPVVARSVRLIPLSSAGGPIQVRPRLAELEAIAEPGVVLDAEGFDIARPDLGGHVVRASGFGEQILTGEGTQWPGPNPIYLPTERSEAAEWVIGFRNGRAAQLAAIVWHERSDAVAEERIRKVAVATSLAGALGPWSEIGSFELGDAPDSPLVLSAPVWARAVRFTVLEPAEGRLTLPERVEIREAPGPSIVGMWSDLSQAGPYEAQAAPPQASPAPSTGVSHDANAPTPLALASLGRGEVRRGVTEDWYSIELPEGTLQLSARFEGNLAPTVSLTLVAPDGTETPFQSDRADPSRLFVEAGPGPARIRVVQPTASVAVTWDTSGSVGALGPAIQRMIRRLAWALDPQREAINLLPFVDEGGQFLMSEWSGERGKVFAALHAYPFADQSSDAENSLLVAARELGQRAGQRAVVIVTDASYSFVAKNEALWRALAAGQVQVFALYLPVDYDPVRVSAQTAIMSDWAHAAGGHISRFASQGDSETAFRRVAAWLSRPAKYAFSLAAETTPPPPGLLVVDYPEGVSGPDATRPAAASVSLGIILDASGSMLQRIGSERRIDIAKQVLHEMGDDILPEGLPISLRVFGHDRPDSCESELFLPLAPLDRAAFAAAVDRVQSINLARTSIATSLHAVADDLAGAQGPKVVVLVTDGEETCGGDPLAEITRLRAEGIDTRINIVGFAVEDAVTQDTFEAWAEAGGGQHFEADDPTGLRTAIQQAMGLPYTVLDPSGKEVARGIVGADPIELPPGDYQIVVGSGAVPMPVTIQSGATATLVLDGP